MFITDIEEGAEIIIDVMHGTNKLTFESKSVKALEDALLIESIRHNDQLVNMNTKHLVMTLTANVEPLPVKFQQIHIETVRYHNEVYHLVKTQREGQEVNRRECYRVYIGVKGEAQINAHKKVRDVLVKDVSVSGFAIVSTDDLATDDAIVRLTYLDKEQKIILHGRVVRKVELEANKILYGCQLLHTPSGLGKYLNQKQMDKNKQK